MVSFMRKHYCKVSMFQVGYDAKLFVSAILSNQMIYDENRVVPYEETGDNVKGYFAVLNSGSSPQLVLSAIKNQTEQQAELNSEMSKSEKALD